MTLQTEGLGKRRVGHKLSTDVTYNGGITCWNSDRMITSDFRQTLTDRMFDIFKPTASCGRGHGENNESVALLSGGGSWEALDADAVVFRTGRKTTDVGRPALP